MRPFFVVACLCALLSLPAVLRAQSISGTVVDSSGAGLPGVSVSLPALHRGAVTGVDGRYRIAGIITPATSV